MYTHYLSSSDGPNVKVQDISSVLGANSHSLSQFFSTFLHFSSALVALRKDLQCLRVFGCDGEKALINAFMHEYRFAIHLHCSIHACNNIKKNLRERRLPELVVNEITDEIFGKQVGSSYVEGLVDAESE